ncbi:MAG: DUF1326 domain-containing protein [Terriglobia bacterium]
MKTSDSAVLNSLVNGRYRSLVSDLLRRGTHRLSVVACLLFLVSGLCFSAGPPNLVRYDGAAWKVKGAGIVCCPCTVPCPCRTNAAPSYGHCEATLYLRIRQGHYGNVSLDGMQVIDSGGMCAVSYKQLSALYFDSSASPAQRLAMMKLIASFSPEMVTRFPHVRVVHIDSKITDDRLFNVSIPGILQMVVDRDWGGASPPMPMVAAPDHFSNLIQYVQNIRYRLSDPTAGLDFDYSHRQANYRIVDLGMEQYRSKSMLIQFATGKGWFAPQQLQLIKLQHLAVPQLEVIRKEAIRLRDTRIR